MYEYKEYLRYYFYNLYLVSPYLIVEEQGQATNSSSPWTKTPTIITITATRETVEAEVTRND